MIPLSLLRVMDLIVSLTSMILVMIISTYRRSGLIRLPMSLRLRHKLVIMFKLTLVVVMFFAWTTLKLRT